MALQKINWTQIDSASVPTGSTVDLGALPTPLDGVFTNILFIEGINFFDYLDQLGYTGVTPNAIVTEDHVGIKLIPSLTGKTILTTYNTALDPTLSTPSTVGGISVGTTVSELSGKTFVEFVDELLFPTILPTYTIPTITLAGVSSQILEAGSTLSRTLSPYGIKNDAGAFSQIRILRGGTPILTTSLFTIISESSIPSQFGYTDPNNPNYRYTINPSYNEIYVIPLPTFSNTSSSTIYYVDSNYGSGTSKRDNKGNYDTRTPAVRGTNAPQASGTNFASSSVTITGIYPYFWGVSLILPTASAIATAISMGSANKVLSDASGTLSIPYNINGYYIWFAYYSPYTTKTKWYVNALDNGNIDNSFISTVVQQLVNSPEGYWSAKMFKMHWSVYPTIQNTIQFLN